MKLLEESDPIGVLESCSKKGHIERLKIDGKIIGTEMAELRKMDTRGTSNSYRNKKAC